MYFETCPRTSVEMENESLSCSELFPGRRSWKHALLDVAKDLIDVDCAGPGGVSLDEDSDMVARHAD